MGVTYFSSSKVVAAFWKEHGQPVIIIDQMFTDVQEARDYEEWMLKSYNVKVSEEWLNLQDFQGPPIMFGDKNPMRRPEVIVKFMGENSPSKRPEMRKLVSDRVAGDKNPSKRPEVRAKISATLMGQSKGKFLGELNPRFNSELYIFEHDELGTFIGTQHAFRDKYNLRKAGVSAIKTGRNKTCQGWRFSGTVKDNLVDN